MAVYAVVEAGAVINIAEWDGKSEWKPEKGKAVLTKAPVSPGWLYDGRKFTAPNVDEKGEPVIVDAQTD